MKNLNFTKRMKNVVVLAIALLSFNNAFSAEPKTTDRFSNQSNQINKVAYPQTAKDNNVEGRVIVYFELLNGETNNITVIQTEDSILNETAIEIVNALSSEYIKELEDSGKTEFLLPVNFEIIR